MRRNFDRRKFFNTSYIQSGKSHPAPSYYCQKWAVSTTISAVSFAIRQLLGFSDWCVVVVADMKSVRGQNSSSFFQDANFSDQRHVYLTPHQQSALPFSVVSLLPWNHFGRKNVGYLFAVHQGAKMIYDLDDDNILKPGMLPKELPTVCVGTMSDKVVNPYPMFGPKTTWPRGLPLDLVKNTDTRTYSRGWNNSCGHLGILQSLADEDPDVDAIFRLTSPHFPHSFRTRPFPVVIKRGSFAPFNAQATMFNESCFWALLLPVTVHGRVSDIWRGYIAQAIMKHTGHLLAFSSPWVVQKRNPHDILSDFDAEIPLYTQSSSFVKFLRGWKCLEGTVPGCLEALYIDVYERGIIEVEDVNLLQAWLTDLLAIGY
ncbi:hypothetical protein T484DRAFT_1649289, partial [Baffinella frigidus]